jgi:hypothetical protein
MRNAHRILARKRQRNRVGLGRPRHRLFSTGLGVGPAATDFCDDSTETSGEMPGSSVPIQQKLVCIFILLWLLHNLAMFNAYTTLENVLYIMSQL